MEISVFKDNPTASLRMASFYDYGLEGWLAYEVAKENGEKPPLLLCCVEEERGIDSRYEKHLKKLSPVEELVVVEYQFRHRSRHMIYRVDDEQAYLDIWAEASEDHSIAEATFPANTDIQKLKSVLSRQHVLTTDKEVDAWCDWVYFQVYGGGSDEHHAIFRSKNPQITQRVWQWVGENQISRF